MTTTNPLSEFSTQQLRNEIEKRQEKEKKLIEKGLIQKEIEQWHNRPKCALIGRAYARGNGVKKISLARISIPGNMGHTYDVVRDVCSTTEMFFHNVWEHQIERKFEQDLQKLVNEFIEKLRVDPVIVASLIGLSQPHNREFPDLIEAWHQAAMERLCEFTLKDLEQALKNTVNRWATAHGQERLLKDAIEIKQR